MTLGTGSPTSLHSKMIFASSSVCRMMGRSVKVGFTPALDGRGASSPENKSNISILLKISEEPT